MQHDRLDAAGDLDRPDRIRGVDDVRRIAARAERLLALDQVELLALVAEADAVGDRRQRPLGLEERRPSGVGQQVVVQAHDHADLELLGHRGAQPLGDRAVGRPGRGSERELVALGERPSLIAPQGTEHVSGPALEFHRYVDAAAHGDVHPRATLDVAERQHVAALHRERRPRLPRLAVDSRLELGAGDRNHARLAEAELGSHVGALQRRGAAIVAHQQVCGDQRELVQRARGRDPDVVEAEPPDVLNGRREAGLDDLNRHGAPPAVARCRHRSPRGTPGD